MKNMNKIIGTAASQGGPDKARDRWSVPPEAVEDMVGLSSTAVKLFVGCHKATPPVQDGTGVRGLEFDIAQFPSPLSRLCVESVRNIYVRHGLNHCAKALDQDIQDVPLEILEIVKCDLMNIGFLLGICDAWARKAETSTTQRSLRESSDAKGATRHGGGGPETAREEVEGKRVMSAEAVRTSTALIKMMCELRERQEDVAMRCGWWVIEYADDEYGAPEMLGCVKTRLKDGRIEVEGKVVYFTLNSTTGRFVEDVALAAALDNPDARKVYEMSEAGKTHLERYEQYMKEKRLKERNEAVLGGQS
jgi:hypothetical protein